jgi:DnaK suppressor protein
VSKTTAPPATPAKPAPHKPAAKSGKPGGPAESHPETPPVPSPRPAPRFTSEPMHATKPAAKPDPKLVNVWKTKAGRDLSEPELLAMPDSEYMGEKQLEWFRTRLQEQKDALLSNAGETTEHLREDTSIVPDPADRATIEEEHALELRTRDRERKLLKKISQSLARIESGDYGYCDETGEPIGLARLIARPTATLSLEAQQRREMKQKMFGD